MISHIVGGGFGVLVLVLCVVKSAQNASVSGVISSALYGASMITLYTASSIYHGLRNSTAKKVFQVLDHCTIYFLIGGTYTPILLCAIRRLSPGWAWTLFGVVWGLIALATALTAIDLKKYTVFSMCCYVGIGWCILLAAHVLVRAIAPAGLALLLGGGVVYTIGAILYGIGKKRRYIHALFHIFVIFGSILQFLCIYLYVL